MPDVKQLIALWEGRGGEEKESAPASSPPDTLTDPIQDQLTVQEKAMYGNGTEQDHLMKRAYLGGNLANNDEETSGPTDVLAEKAKAMEMDDRKKAFSARLQDSEHKLGPTLERKLADQESAKRGRPHLNGARQYMAALDKQEMLDDPTYSSRERHSKH